MFKVNDLVILDREHLKSLTNYLRGYRPSYLSSHSLLNPFHITAVQKDRHRTVYKLDNDFPCWVYHKEIKLLHDNSGRFIPLNSLYL